jgi:hypothetical protein
MEEREERFEIFVEALAQLRPELLDTTPYWLIEAGDLEAALKQLGLDARIR